MIKWAKSVTKRKMVNNFPTTILTKNWFMLKGRLVCLKHLRADRFLINLVFEELFKMCSRFLSPQWHGLAQLWATECSVTLM